MALGRLTLRHDAELFATFLLAWKDAKTAARLVDDAIDDFELRRAIDAALVSVDAFGTFERLLPIAERVEVMAKLRAELADMGNLGVLGRVGAPTSPREHAGVEAPQALSAALSFGMRLNQHKSIMKRRHSLPEGCPDWATWSQRDDWCKLGVVLWDTPTKTVTRLKATQAMKLLTALRGNRGWEERDITVGEPVNAIPLDESDAKGRDVLVNAITLDPQRTHTLMAWLTEREALLSKIARVQADESADALADICKFTLKRIAERERESADQITGQVSYNPLKG